MRGEDEQFEAFLRQFRPAAPRPLPRRRVTAWKVALAAAIMLAAAIPLRPLWKQPTRSFEPAASRPGVSRPATTIGPQSDAAGPAGQALLPTAPLVIDGDDIRAPKRIYNVNPAYPDEARAAQVEGIVVLQIIVGKTGSVTVERVVRSVPLLDDAAIDAVSQWEYEPTLLNGRPVEVQMNVTISFVLQ